MVLQRVPEGGQAVAIGILDPENAVRVAHIHHAGAGEHAAIGQRVGEIDGARILEGPRQRNAVPFEAGHAHIDGDEPVRPGLGFKHAGAGFDGKPVPAKFGVQQRPNTAAGIAAGVHFRAVGIQNAHEHIGGARAAPAR